MTADLRLIEASKLQADESALTGESVPIGKQVEPVDEDVPLAERASMVHKGTAITRGSGEGVVVATGMDTELGHISSLVEEAEQEATPLEKRLDRLGRRLVWVTLGIGAFVLMAGHERYDDLAKFFAERADLDLCESGVDVRDLPQDCLEAAAAIRYLSSSPYSNRLLRVA